MSSTMTLTMPVLPPPRLSTIPCCPNCGTDLSLTFVGSPDGEKPPNDSSVALRVAQKQIDDMQAQIRLLNDKATAAVDRWADYEDELSKLRRELDASRRSGGGNRDSGRPSTPRINTPDSPASKSSTASPGAGVSSFATAATNRISALLSRKSTPNLKAQQQQQQQPGHQSSHSASQLLPTPPPSGGHHQSSYSTSSLLSPRSPLPLSLSLSSGRVLSYTPGSDGPPPSTDDLLDALTREQRMRVDAERQLDASSREVEELSVTLFTQANEMVATERREKARLEERVGELEKRESEKKKRLERLESAMGRIERVRNLIEEK